MVGSDKNAKQSAERRFISSAQMGYAGAVRYGDRTVGNGRCFDDFCLVLTLQDIPQGIILPLAIGAMGVGTFLGGYVSARIVGQKGLLCGFLTGLLYYLVLTGISLAIMHFSLDASQAVKMGVALAAACVGGVLGINGKGKRRA